MHTHRLARAVAFMSALALLAMPLRAIEDEAKIDQPEFLTIEELEKLPTGLKVVHEPTTALATLTGKSERRAKYTWWYKTTVTAIDSDVTIEEFGGFTLVDGKWVNGGAYTGKPYGATEFAEWYKCEHAKLAKGKSVADPTNWSTADDLMARKDRWYFVGTDAKGRRVKGEAIIELKAEIDPKKPKDSDSE